MYTEHGLNFIPKKLKFFLELNTNRKTDDEIYTFFCENILDSSPVDLIMEHLRIHQKIELLFKF